MGVCETAVLKFEATCLSQDPRLAVLDETLVSGIRRKGYNDEKGFPALSSVPVLPQKSLYRYIFDIPIWEFLKSGSWIQILDPESWILDPES